MPRLSISARSAPGSHFWLHSVTLFAPDDGASIEYSMSVHSIPRSLALPERFRS